MAATCCFQIYCFFSNRLSAHCITKKLTKIRIGHSRSSNIKIAIFAFPFSLIAFLFFSVRLFFKFGDGHLLLVHGSPRVPYIGYDEGNKKRYNTHNLKSELAGGTIVNGKRALKVGYRGVKTCVVVPNIQQQCQYGKNCTNACKPDPAPCTTKQCGNYSK